MTLILIALAVGLCCYLIGSINCSILISRRMNRDVRDSGSGNAGATNMLRTFGWKAGVLTLVCDFLKTLLPMLAVWLLFREQDYWQALVAFGGFCCALGHVFPLYFGFRGGKAVTVIAMVYCVVDWRCLLIGVSIFILTVALTRYVSLGSILGVTAAMVALFFLTPADLPYRWFVLLCGSALPVMIVLLHLENIKRLLKGTERKISFHKK